MEIFDKHFIKLPFKKQIFVVSLSLGYFLVGLVGYLTGLMTIIEGFLLFVIGSLYAHIIRLHYRIEKLEKK